MDAYKEQILHDFLQENMAQFVSFIENEYQEAELIAEEIVTALKGE